MGFNSNSGHSAVMSQSSGKIFDYATKGKKCGTCEYAERSKTNPKIHDCRKNHNGSSKSMEPLSAVKLFKSAPNHGIKYSTYTGDEDSTTELYLNQKVLYCIKKFYHTHQTLSLQDCTISVTQLNPRIVPHCQQKLSIIL